MKTFMLSAVTLFALHVVGANGLEARGQGIHFGGGGVHVDVGNPHGYGGYGHCGTGGYGNYYGNTYGYYPQTSYYGGGWGGHSQWHDTTHLDYHPGEYRRHRNHYHYSPGHYDVHEDGHWDHHGF